MKSGLDAMPLFLLDDLLREYSLSFMLGAFEFLEASDLTIACFQNLLKILPSICFFQQKCVFKPFC